MSKKTISALVVLSALAVIGILSTQVFWIRKAYDLRERQFEQTVTESLEATARDISASRPDSCTKLEAQIVPLSSAYYLVNLNVPLDTNQLEYALRTQFHLHHVITEFEYGYFDRMNGRVVYGSMTNDPAPLPSGDLALLSANSLYSNYFVVRFPNQRRYLTRQLDGWALLSAIVAIIIGFFGYVLYRMLQQKQVSEMQRDFINNMTHEFQTPISAIKLATDILASPRTYEQPERILKYVKMVQEENQRLQQQVETVLTLARTEKKTFTLKTEPIDVHDLLRSIADRHEGYLTLDLQAQASVLKADRLHLTNVLCNLLDNALKYSPIDPHIRFLTRTIGDQLVIMIEDNGIGIAPEHQEKIFNAFYRVPEGSQHCVKGFGLGLSYVQKIVKAHRWKLDLDSTVGKGSTFIIRVPQTARQPEPHKVLRRVWKTVQVPA
ncbi:sensor histidine kinase [Tellurirhabdus rosea]|uniref:sensor histidine kinase n=1 Tax=Tellurirhabdus rosea TaxID=2674997 RepID=UPI002254B0CB|nr:HAMP domain-containing sensor histidine kinase [Tellurirhabdus rosea]